MNGRAVVSSNRVKANATASKLSATLLIASCDRVIMNVASAELSATLAAVT